MASEVERVGETPAEQAIDALTLDLGGSERVAIGRVVDRKSGEVRVMYKIQPDKVNGQ